MASSGSPESRYLFYSGYDILRRYQPGALELLVRPFVHRTPHEVLVFELVPHIIPAAGTPMMTDDTIRGVELISLLSES